eukprot:scaffold544_cov320-Pavlova_lutheri.AAC.79
MAPWRVPPPPLMAIQRGELKSVASWEVRGRHEEDPVDSMLEEAVRGPLSPRRKGELAMAIASGRTRAERWSSEWMDKLVEHNPEVLVEALSADQGAGDATRMALVAMDVSLASLEVVHMLVAKGAMAEEYVLVHLLNCLERCREGDEGSGKNRKARLFCLYLQKMIRDGLVDGASNAHEQQRKRGGADADELVHVNSARSAGGTASVLYRVFARAGGGPALSAHQKRRLKGFRLRMLLVCSTRSRISLNTFVCNDPDSQAKSVTDVLVAFSCPS